MKKMVNMRLEENIISIIEKQIGGTFTEKFVNLVELLDKQEEAKKQTIKYLDSQITEKESRLKDLAKCLEDARVILRRW